MALTERGSRAILGSDAQFHDSQETTSLKHVPQPFCVFLLNARLGVTSNVASLQSYCLEYKSP